MSNYFFFRYRRSLRRVRRQMRLINRRVTAYVDRHIWGKWHQFRLVRRFFTIWWAVFAITFIGVAHQISVLSRANLVSEPLNGGTFIQAEVGTVKILNPVLPDTSPSADINRLIFSGLTRYNAERQPEPDLATGWQVSSDGRTYTFNLRHGVKWQDGVPFTSTDVAFTVAAIQNPDSRSPLASSWQGVTVATPDDYTVTFTLPAPLDSFIDSTTLGIVPRHLLEQVDPAQLDDASFNQQPVGTGPFMLKTFDPSADEVELVANPNYYLGKPKLDGFTFHFYDTPADALTAYASHQVTSPGEITSDELGQASGLHHLSQTVFTLPEETTLFFNTLDPILSDATLRGILSHAINRQTVLNNAAGGQGLVVTQPLLPGQIGYTSKYAASPLSVAAAKAALDADGWTMAKGSDVRRKDGQALTLSLVTTSGAPLETAADNLATQLNALGVKVTVNPVSLDELQQTYMRPRNFQMLLFGVNIGADPDVYAFWHSSQAKDPGINLSQYSDPAADAALESGRIKTDPALRAAKYDAFLKAWNTDNPAAVLYESGYDYGVSDSVMGLTAHALVTPDDIFANVQNWTVRERFVRH